MSIGSLDDAGRMGALGFVLEAIGAGQFRNGRPEESDPVRTTITYWCADDKDPAILRALGDAHERMQARGAGAEQGPATDPAGFARLLAVFNPYAALALNLSVGRDNEWIAAEAKASDDWLIRDNALLPWDATATPATGRDHPISGIARLGLFAEWAQASAYLRGDADLRLIGRSAEAWRRTAAGQWRYGRPPHGWTGPEPVDATMRDRLQALARSRDPRHAAMFQLGLWSAHPDGSGENVWRRLRKRLRGVAAALPKNSKDALEDCARLLLKRRMPSAFVPAAAVLILSGDG
jgi:hypothetical protein